MMKSLTEVVEEEQFYTKSLANNVIKLVSLTPDTYRKIVTHCKERNIYYHTYQLKEERAFRVVLKHLHHSFNLDIKQELSSLGHAVRNIINVEHRLTKEPLSIFFIDIEPATNNKDIYAIKAIQNKIIQFEPPHSNKHHIPQCMRCQLYGHTRTYCNRPFNCVKCGGPHNSETCPKPRETPAKCALCGGPHPANYKGCEQYRHILRGHNPHRLASMDRPTPLTQEDFPPIPASRPQQPHQIHQTKRSYAEVISNNVTPPNDPTAFLTSFLVEFRTLFSQLIQQNGQILNMLTALLNARR